MRTGMPVALMGCSLAAALAVTGPLGAQTDGSVTWNLQTAGATHTMVQYFKGSQMRIETEMADMLVDGSAGTMTMLMPSQKMYMQYTADQLGNMPNMQRAPASAGQLSITPDGHETVAGIPCTDYKLTGAPSGDTEICAAPGVPSMDPTALMNGPMGQLAAKMGMTPQMADAYKQLKGQGALKISKIDAAGTKTLVMEATKIDRTPPAASLFQVPQGYQKLAMPAGMGGMPGMAQPKSP
jgi:hypothetical protein